MAGRDSRGRFVRGSGSSGRDAVEIDVRGWEALRRVLETLKTGGSYVKAGVIGTLAGEQRGRHSYAAGAPEEPMTNARLAAILEFGAKLEHGEIPARGAILGTFELNRARYIGLLKTKILPAIYAAKITPAQGLKILGEMMASDMRNRIVEGEGIPPPNSPATIRRKLAKGKWNAGGKSSGAAPRPLVDTGRFRNAISYAVVVQDVETPGTPAGGD